MMGALIGGLWQDIKIEVQAACLKSLLDAYDEARALEERFKSSLLLDQILNKLPLIDPLLDVLLHYIKSLKNKSRQ